MSKFCGKCGTQIVQGDLFCNNCGASIDAQQTTQTQAGVAQIAPEIGYVKNKKKSAKKSVIVISIIAFVLIAAILFVAIFGLRTPKSIANKFMKAMFVDADAESIVAMMPKEFIEYYENESDESKEDYIEFLQDSIDYMHDEFDERFAEDWFVDWEITDVKNLKSAELKELENVYEESLDIEYNDIKRVIVKAPIKYTLDGDNVKETEDMEVYVIKIGQKWYLEPMQVMSMNLALMQSEWNDIQPKPKTAY